MRPLGIYLHIPFCVRKCAYCDFLSAPASGEVRERYVKALCREIGDFAPRAADRQAVSIFLGGGTPTVLEGRQLAEILDTVRRVFPHISDRAEITAECNPGTVDKEKLRIMREAGVNRLSMGIQSADDQELKLLGRIHTWETGRKQFLLAREAGFDNINLDLIYGLPGQRLCGWKQTLGRVMDLEPEHISAYSLIIEEGTPFYQQYHREDVKRSRGDETPEMSGAAHLPSEDEELAMARETRRMLAEKGLQRYEISNYARPGYESVHNTGYWTRREYAGFGIGAASLINGLRFKNGSSLEDYLAGWTGGEKTRVGTGPRREEEIRLSPQDEMEETMYLGLRMTRGVSLAGFEETFGKKLTEIYEAPVRKYLRQELLVIEDGYLRLTGRGMEVSNLVMSDFLL